jgi:protein tyrosine/serine phosphatase
MPPASLVNFRDLGGLRGLGGHQIRSGRLYRSAQLSCLAEADHEAFTALGIRTVMDLRRPFEITSFGRLGIVDGFVLRDVYLRHRIWQPQDAIDTTGPTTVDTRARARYLADRYRDMADEALTDIGEALRVIADPATCPVVVHCVAGKDRTGVVIGLTLALLGVHDDVIADDFAASEPEQYRLTEWLVANVPAAHDPRPEYLLAPRESMLVFLTELRERYGSVDAYVAAAGVTERDVASMREHLLEPASG